MPDIQVITGVISNLGFPIAVCVFLGWYLIKSNQNHRDETKELQKAISDLTIVITELRDAMRNILSGENKND